jgi:hypothetical protein
MFCHQSPATESVVLPRSRRIALPVVPLSPPILFGRIIGSPRCSAARHGICAPRDAVQSLTQFSVLPDIPSLMDDSRKMAPLQIPHYLEKNIFFMAREMHRSQELNCCFMIGRRYDDWIEVDRRRYATI